MNTNIADSFQRTNCKQEEIEIDIRQITDKAKKIKKIKINGYTRNSG